ncbi:DNA polymerase IV [Acidobacteriota bacterium]
MAQRWILHVDMDAFFVEVERTLDPSLRGKPVAVGGSPEGRGVVTSASYEARTFGVRAAMTARRAKELCPHILFVRGHYEHYTRASKAMFEILREYSPLVEPASIDEGYVDLTGFDRLYGPALATAHRIREDIRTRLNLSASAGLAVNKLVSKIATNCAKPGGLAFIPSGMEQDFLAPLPIDALPGIGPKLSERLRQMGIKTLGRLSALNPDLLARAFGTIGPVIGRRAKGIDYDAVKATRGRPKSIGRSITYGEDTEDMDLIESTLYCLIEKIGRELRGEGLGARTVTVRIRYSDFETRSASTTLAEPRDLDAAIYDASTDLLKNLYTRRARLRLVGVAVSGLTETAWQLALFSSDSKRRSLYKAMDGLRENYGSDCLLTGRTLRHRSRERN